MMQPQIPVPPTSAIDQDSSDGWMKKVIDIQIYPDSWSPRRIENRAKERGEVGQIPTHNI